MHLAVAQLVEQLRHGHRAEVRLLLADRGEEPGLVIVQRESPVPHRGRILRHGQPRRPQAADHADRELVVGAEDATRQSALTAGLGDRVGALLPGGRADVVLVDLGAPHMQPLHDVAAALVLSVQESDVRTVLVEGRVLVDEGRLTTVDVQEAIDGLTARIPQLRDRSHGRRIQDYAP